MKGYNFTKYIYPWQAHPKHLKYQQAQVEQFKNKKEKGISKNNAQPIQGETKSLRVKKVAKKYVYVVV